VPEGGENVNIFDEEEFNVRDISPMAQLTARELVVDPKKLELLKIEEE
jgi:hypothetical protein